jgi:hypothetical protein
VFLLIDIAKQCLLVRPRRRWEDSIETVLQNMDRRYGLDSTVSGYDK